MTIPATTAGGQCSRVACEGAPGPPVGRFEAAPPGPLRPFTRYLKEKGQKRKGEVSDCAVLRSSNPRVYSSKALRLDGINLSNWAEHSLPLAPRLFSFPFFSPSFFVSIFPGGKTPWKSSNLGR